MYVQTTLPGRPEITRESAAKNTTSMTNSNRWIITGSVFFAVVSICIIIIVTISRKRTLKSKQDNPRWANDLQTKNRQEEDLQREWADINLKLLAPKSKPDQLIPNQDDECRMPT